MHVLEAERDGESSAEIVAVGSQVHKSVKQYVSSFLAVVGKKASGVRPAGPSVVLSDQLQKVAGAVDSLKVRVEAIRSREVMDLVRAELVPPLKRCIADLNTTAEAFDDLEVAFNLSSRDQKRRLQKDIRKLERYYRGGEMVAEVMIRIVEFLEPTPEDYLTEELSKRYGEDSGNVLTAFERIGREGAISVEDFKNRYLQD